MSLIKELKSQNRLSRSLMQYDLTQETDSSQTSIETIHILQRWMNIHVNISRRIANLESSESILSTIVQLLQRFLRSDVVAIMLWNDTKSDLEIRYLANPKEVVVLENVIENCELLFRTLNTCRAIRYPDDIPLCRDDLLINGISYASGIIAPLFMDSEPIGGLVIGKNNNHKFNVIDLMGCRSLAEQAVITLEHELMKSRLQTIAVMEERSRIAREMHDSVVQILGYLSLELYSIQTYVQQLNIGKAIFELELARENVKNAQIEARENILCLRTTCSDQDNLIDTLHKYLLEFGQVTKIRVHWKNDLSAVPKLSPLAEIQLLRIVQEALTNVRKHAQSDDVWLSLTSDHSELLVVVKDNGVGFIPEEHSRHFGLQTMEERAKNVSGKLTILSKENHGTSVELRLPILTI